MLFNPPVAWYQGVQYKMNPTLGLPILAAVLNVAGHDCEVVDLEALGYTPERFGQAWAGQKDRWPDVVGFTALSSQARGARESIAAIRQAGYTGKVAVGGVHATLAPEEVASWPGVDLVVRGECEGDVAALLQHHTGVWLGTALPIEQIPAPDWSRHNPAITTYQGNYPMLTPPQSISMWTRGCPHKCIFCANEVFGRQPIRYRPPANVAAEMADLKARHVKSVFVYDDELLGLKAPDGWWQEIAERVGPLGLVWKGQGRCSERHVTPEVLAHAYQAGGRVLMWGVESFSQAVLDANKKGTRLTDIWTTLRRAKAAGLRNWVFSMVGMYGETDEDAALTCEGLRAAYAEGLVDYRQTTVCTVVPGTELHRLAVKEGWYTPAPESGPQMHQAYQNTPWMSAERIGYWVRKFDEVCPVGAAGKVAA